MHQLPTESAVPTERTDHQAAANQALDTAGAGSRTPEPDHCQREERHTQEEEVKLPRILEAAWQRVAEHPAELEHSRHEPLAACTLRRQQDLTWEAYGRGPPHGGNPEHAWSLSQACH